MPTTSASETPASASLIEPGTPGAVRKRFRALCTAIGLLISASPSYAADQPCWMQAPQSTANIGQIGISRSLSASSQTPETVSRIRALAGLCSYFGMSCTDEILEKALDAGSLEGRKIYFDQYAERGYIYAYAALNPIDADQCAPDTGGTCQIERCDPAWLCASSADGKPTLLGVSYRSMDRHQQSLNALENALAQATYMFGVNVQANASLKQGRVGGQNFLLHWQQGSVDTSRPVNVPYHVARQCRSGATLYQQVVLGLPDVDTTDLENDDTGWITNPKHLGLDGAVGIVERPAASGLVSDQIDLAIKQAAIQLAYEKTAHLSSSSLTVTSNQNGLFEITQINQQTATTLTARVKRIRFDRGAEPGKSWGVRVMVWLVLQSVEKEPLGAAD